LGLRLVGVRRSAFGHSAFGHSAFGHSAFGHSPFAIRHSPFAIRHSPTSDHPSAGDKKFIPMRHIHISSINSRRHHASLSAIRMGTSSKPSRALRWTRQ